MQDVNIEFNRGVLFVRLTGDINSVSEIKIKNKILNILKEGGIQNLVFNIENLKISGEITLFNECKNLVDLNNGKMIICTGNNNININYDEVAKDELSALRMINVC